MSTSQTIADLLMRRGSTSANRTAAQGQIWGTAISSIGQQIASIPAQRRAAEQQAQAGELRGLQIKDARGELADKEKARARQAAIEGVLSKYDDIEQALPELYKVAPSEAAAIQKHVNDSKKAALEFRTQQIKNKASEAEFVGSLFQGVNDDGALAKALHTAKLALPERDWSQYSGVLATDRALLDADVAAALSVKDKADLDIKRLSEERQVATQKAAAANLEADNKRAVETLEETKRHNEALEKNAAIQANAALTRARRPASGSAAAGGLDPDAVEYTATQYRILGPSGIPTRIGEGDKVRILNEAAKQAHALGQTPAQAVTKQLTVKADASALTTLGKLSSSAEAFENKALGQAGIIDELSAKVGRTKWPIINAAIQSGRERITGDEDATKLANAVTTFSAEYAKIMEGSTGSVAGSSDASRKAAERLINTAMSKGTMAGVLDLMRREMRLTIIGYDVAKERITSRIGGAPQAPTVQPTLRFNPATGKVEPIK